MALTERNGIWHWRKIIQGHTFARSTKTGDKKLAEQIAALWESALSQPLLSTLGALFDMRQGAQVARAGGHGRHSG